jgi:hypothetical protein
MKQKQIRTDHPVTQYFFFRSVRESNLSSVRTVRTVDLNFVPRSSRQGCPVLNSNTPNGQEDLGDR